MKKFACFNIIWQRGAFLNAYIYIFTIREGEGERPGLLFFSTSLK